MIVGLTIPRDSLDNLSNWFFSTACKSKLHHLTSFDRLVHQFCFLYIPASGYQQAMRLSSFCWTCSKLSFQQLQFATSRWTAVVQCSGDMLVSNPKSGRCVWWFCWIIAWTSMNIHEQTPAFWHMRTGCLMNFNDICVQYNLFCVLMSLYF